MVEETKPATSHTCMCDEDPAPQRQRRVWLDWKAGRRVYQFTRVCATQQKMTPEKPVSPTHL